MTALRNWFLAAAAMAAPGSALAQNPTLMPPPPRAVPGLNRTFIQPQSNTLPFRDSSSLVNPFGRTVNPYSNPAAGAWNPATAPAINNPAFFNPGFPNPAFPNPIFRPLVVPVAAVNPVFNPGTLNPLWVPVPLVPVPPIAVRQPGVFIPRGVDLRVNPWTGAIYRPYTGVVVQADGSTYYRVPGTGTETFYNPETGTYLNPTTGVISRPGGFLPYIW